MSSNLHTFPISRTVSEVPAVEQYWTVKQVAQRLQCGESTVKRWLSEGRLRKTKLGDLTRVTETDLTAFARAGTAGR